MAAPSVTLNDDGICEDFFNLLWIRDELNFGPAINIPDTVIFKYGQPTHWYFTATDGRIKRKNRQNLINARIEEAFSKYILGYDVVATFISLATERNPETGKSQPSTVQFLDKAALNEFLYSSKKDCSGILQRFVDPKGNKNELIRGIWSPKICLLERTENIHFLHDLRFGLYERCVTCEGPDYYSVSTPLRGPVLAGQIQKICESVVSHVAEVTYNQKKITRIVINFKVDSRDKIWLLYTTSIRCDDDTVIIPMPESQSQKIERKLLNINSVLTLPSSVNLNPYKSYGKIIPRARVRCISCGNETLDNMRHPVTYKSVLKHFEHLLHIVKTIAKGQFKEKKVTWPPDKELIDAAGGVGFGCLELISDVDDIANAKKGLTNNVFDSDQLTIPPIIRYLHPKLNAATYNRCKMDPLFLHKTVHVCEPCYLVYAEFATMMLRLGSDLSKILTADSQTATVHTMPTTVKHQQMMQSQTNRPSSAEWREMSTLNRSRSLSAMSSPTRSRNHIMAKESAIGLRTSDAHVLQPGIPSVIRNSVDTLSYQFPVATSAPGLTSTQANTLYNANASMDSIDSFRTNPALAMVNPLDVGDVIAERERRFFKEIARNPQLREQHPLLHLISAQQKLAVADQLSGVFETKESAAKQGLFASAHTNNPYGRQGNDKHDALGAYRVLQQYVVNGVVTVPEPLTKGLPKSMKAHSADSLKKRDTRIKSDASLLTEDPDMLTQTQISNSKATKSLGSTVLRKQERKHNEHLSKHQQFLADTLQQVAGEVMKDDPNSSAAAAASNAYIEQSKPPASTTTHTSGPSSIGAVKKKSKLPKHFAGAMPPPGELAPGGVVFNENDDNGSTESGLLRDLGLGARNSSKRPPNNTEDLGSGQGSLAENSQDDAFSFSKSLTSDQRLEEYGIGAADSLRNVMSASQILSTKGDELDGVDNGVDNADNDSLLSGSTVSVHSSLAIRDFVDAISST
jgi:hypothetical protein